ncbi:MAG: DUF4431 domain-containing protein [Rhodopseudomonas sp.]|uniref:DUF4431 domain-containing protein n=1 Tax=Rhodopseudomonas sp. TaxID=1078 RepID=UPI001830B6DE|nr:DUF4431 domain-containing protein [Rhodopseudomonas sp.]NVN84599.1 DUF4431 domain-containing protein [Rhodopseudomonas sp.]
MTTKRKLFLAAVLVLGAPFAGPAGAAATDSCLDIDSSRTVVFDGKLTHKVFPGPPNFEDVGKGDRPEPSYILQLQKSICVVGIDKQVDRVQIFPELPEQGPDNRALWAKLKSLIGKQVTVTGTSAFTSFTGHHHAPLLLPITEIQRAPAEQR